MDIEQVYIEKRDNFVLFISELRAESPCGLPLKEPKHNQGFYNTYCISPNLDYPSFQGYKILLKAAIASGTVDSYVEKFLLDNGLMSSAYQLTGLPRSRGTLRCLVSYS